MRTFALVFGLALVACSNPVEGDGGSSSSGGGTSTTATTATTTATTTTDPSTTVEPSTGPAESTGPDESSGPADSGSTTGEPSACDFPAAVLASIADAENPTDCGQLTLADPMMAWDDARDCARQAQLSQSPFSLMWQWDDGGTTRDRAFASNGFSMPLMYFEDDDAGNTKSISQVTCSGTGNPDKCVVAVGEPCLECLDPTISIELCE